MMEAQHIVDEIKQALPKAGAGTLRFFGQWFGRPMDTVHTIVDATVTDNCLTIQFDKGESLKIWDPDGFVADARTFRIAHATHLLWSWYEYGTLPSPKTLHHEEYVVRNSSVEGTSTADGAPQPHPTMDAPAVELYVMPE